MPATTQPSRKAPFDRAYVASATEPQRRPLARAGDARFWDRIADAYAKSPISDEASYRHKLDITRRYFSPDATVFEFGCGTGSTAILHAPYVRHIKSTDISGRMLEIARSKAEAEGVGNLSFAQGAIEDFASERDAYDVVLGLNILHLVPDQASAVGAAFDMLKAGGVFVSSTVLMGQSWHPFRLVAVPGRWLGFFPYVEMLTEPRLKGALLDAGFEIVETFRPKGPKVSVPSLFAVARKPGSAT